MLGFHISMWELGLLELITGHWEEREGCLCNSGAEVGARLIEVIEECNLVSFLILQRIQCFNEFKQFQVTL